MQFYSMLLDPQDMSRSISNEEFSSKTKEIEIIDFPSSYCTSSLMHTHTRGPPFSPLSPIHSQSYSAESISTDSETSIEHESQHGDISRVHTGSGESMTVDTHKSVIGAQVWFR